MRVSPYALLMALFLTSCARPAPHTRLAVILVVDQMRADYVDRFQGDWSAGLKRLVTNGAWFTQAAYPYLETFTCAGHATIGTGAFPLVHGIFQNTWYDRQSGMNVACTEDESVTPISYGKGVLDNDSAARLLIPTFAEEMRRQRRSRVVTASVKARSAIMLAGHGGDAVTWLSDSLDGWQTSTAFSAGPVPEVKAFVSAHPIEADFRKTWNRLLPASAYTEPDDGNGEAPPAGWTAEFPHVLAGSPGDTAPTPAFYDQWQRSPFADAYLGQMAAALVESMKLGQRDVPDVLGISFSSTDLVGHLFGPQSQEIRDILAQLDRTIGLLLERLDTLVGPDNYVVALSADHGVTSIPEQLRAQGRDGGRIRSLEILNAIEAAAVKGLGPGKYVRRVSGNGVYFEPHAFERLTAHAAAMEAVMKAALSQPGIAQVFRGDELAIGATSDDPVERAAALSYVPGRSGDLILGFKPGWMSAANGTTHGTANADDQRVPVIFFGAGVKPGQYKEPITPADIAPTLAEIFGVALKSVQGKALHSFRQ